MAGKQLELADAPQTKLYLAIVNQLTTDPILHRTVKLWQTWTGDPTDKVPSATTTAPWVTLTPRMRSTDFWAPEAQVGWLDIEIVARVRGTCILDVLNLWGAITNALSPLHTDKTGKQFCSKLQDTGAWKGVIKMTQPLTDPSPEAGQDAGFTATGYVSLECVIRAAS